MFCKYCGGQVGEDARFCENCGARLDYDIEDQGEEQHALSGARSEYEGGLLTPAPAEAGYAEPAAEVREMPMKWHKFLVYFWLWLKSVLYFFAGIGGIFGGTVDDEGEAVRDALTAQSAVNIGSGVCFLLLSALGFYAAYKLLHMDRKAPKIYYILLIAGVVFAVLRDIAYALLGVENTDFIDAAFTFAIFGGIAVLQYVYYKKREHLFVN